MAMTSSRTIDSVPSASVAHLPAQLTEVLRNTTMTLQQLSTYYAIKYKSSLAVRVRGAQASTLLEYLEGLSDVFELDGEKVRLRPKAAEASAPDQVAPSEPLATIRYAHISRGLQKLLNETADGSMSIASLEAVFQDRFNTALLSIIGMPTEEYLQRKANVFSVEGRTVCLQPAFLKTAVGEKPQQKGVEPESCPASRNWADATEECEPLRINSPQRVAKHTTIAPEDTEIKQLGAKDACGDLSGDAFVVSELVKIFEEHTEGPIMHSSVLCSLFMQRQGESVTAISGVKPMELFRRNKAAFLWLSSGNVALTKHKDDRAVQKELRLLDEQPKCVRVKAAAAEASLPVPEKVSEQDVVDYLRSLLLENVDRESIYISALCGRFMQRFRRPVTDVVGCKPTDFIRRHSHIFYLEKGGHVRFVDLEGEKARSTAAESNFQQPSKSETCLGRSVNSSPALATHAQSQAADPSGSGSQQQNSAPKIPVPILATVPAIVSGPVAPPWRRSAEPQKPALQPAGKACCIPGTTAGLDRAEKQAEEFCSRLRKCLFFKAVVTLEAVRAISNLEVTVAVRDLPSQLHLTWLPQLLNGLHEVAALRLADQVESIALEKNRLRICLLGETRVELFVQVVAAAE